MSAELEAQAETGGRATTLKARQKKIERNDGRKEGRNDKRNKKK